VEFIGAAYYEGASTTTPTHQVGDLLIVYAIRWGSSTPPSLPAGWTSVHTGTNTDARRLGYKVATATNDSTGTWTNANALFILVYRGLSSLASAASAYSGSGAADYPALSMGGTRPVITLGVSTGDGQMATPAGCTSRWADGYSRIADTADPVASWAGTDGGSYAYMAVAMEAIAALIDVDSDATMSWDVAAPVQVDAVMSWTVDQLMVDSDAAMSWSVAAPVEVDATMLWTVDTLAGWRDLRVSERWESAVTAQVRDLRCRVAVVDLQHRPVSVLDRYGDELGDVPITAGEVEMSGEREQMWSCKLALSDRRWVPRTWRDPLHPLSPYRLAIFWGIHLGGGLWGEIPLGVYRTGRPRTSDRGTVQITVDGLDVMSVFAQGGYGGQVVDVGGLTVDAAVRRLFEAVAPTVPVRVAASTITLPAGLQLGRRRPQEDLDEFVGIGWEDGIARADREGFAYVGERPEPQAVRLRLVEGPGNPLTGVDRELSDTWYNSVLVNGTHPDLTEPVWGVDQDVDESSPTWIGYGVRQLTIDSDAVETEAAALNLARMHRGRWARPQETISGTLRAGGRPDVDHLDLAEVVRDLSAIAGEWRVSGWTCPLPIPGQKVGDMGMSFVGRKVVV